MSESQDVTVEINEQQRQIVEAVRRQVYPDLSLADLVRLGFREWLRTQRGTNG